MKFYLPLCSSCIHARKTAFCYHAELIQRIGMETPREIRAGAVYQYRARAECRGEYRVSNRGGGSA
ncbi:MAG: hypothetical protein QME27_01065 [Syntrophaceae bacterium]|nr:hypothetical protein [Syntrophaceae bacterium]